ncbi:MAG TPA: methyltransferase domain-containing protein [Thermoanaerobaculia bacterium]|nr:methyltransferase domain-containing protein [Thermoanaerobaculia bacterium]
MVLEPSVKFWSETFTTIPNGPKVNLGSGPVQPDDWINIDNSHRAWLASRLPLLDKALVGLGLLPRTEFGQQVKIHDLNWPLPFATDSVSCIYAGEVWEHFEYPDAARLTRECFRALAPGGVLRICVPDGPDFWRKYLALYEEQVKRPRAKRSAKVLRDHVKMYFDDIATRRIWLGSMGHKHKWQFDQVQLIELFECVGFVAVDRMPFHQSRIPDVARVERSDFCIIEGVKPLANSQASFTQSRRW